MHHSTLLLLLLSTPPAQPLTLESVLRTAVEQSPQIRQARHQWEAAKQLKAQAVSLPDPRLSYNHYLRSIETRTGPQRWALGISQTVPEPGKLILSGRIADRDARIAYLRYEALVRNVIAEAKERFFELYYIDRARRVTQAIAQLYDRYAAVAAGEARSGQARLQESFRAESQRAQLGYDLILLEEMRQAEAEALRAVLGLAPSDSLGATAEVAEPIPFGGPVGRLQEIARMHNQELQAAGVEVERARLGVRLAKRAPIPDFTFSLNYISTGNPLLPTPDAGSDPLTVGVGISLPVWWWKFRAQSRQARHQQRAAQAGLESQQSRLRADVAKSYFQLNNASRLVQLYRETLIPQARQAMTSVEELYRTGTADLTSVLETTAAFHNFELARLRAFSDYYQHLARLEQLLGTALDARPQGGSP